VSSANTNSYGYNDALSGFAITGVTDPLKILLTADSSSSTNLLKTMADIDQMRHSNKFIATFPDGHVSVLDSGALNNSAFLYYIDITEQLWNGKTDGLWSIDPNGASGGGQIKSNSIYLYGWTRSGTGLVLDFDPILPGNQAASTGTIKFSAVFPNRGGDNNPNRSASASNMCTSIILCGDSSYSTAVPASRLCEYGVNGSATSSPSSYTSYLGLNSAATYTALSPLCLNGSGGTVTMVCDLNSGGKSSLTIKGASCNGTTVGGQVTTPVAGIWCGVVNSHSGDMTFSNVKFIYYK
jgi:prepilin-type processing-associated H-X9-DG protein